MSDTLKEKTAKGLFWGGFSSGAQQLIGLLAGIVLGRILSPSDYGMIAMITIFSVIATELQNSGFKVALSNLPSPTHQDYNSVFWFNILVSFCLYLLLFFTAPLIAEYYHTPDLVPLCRYAFLGCIFSSFGMAQSAYLFKNLRTKQQAKSIITAMVISNGVGITMALMGFTYWSLATQSNLYILCCTLMYWYYSDWRPSLHWNFTPARQMFRFSCKIMFTAIITQVNNNILNILLGRYYTPKDAGNYNQAYQWNNKASYLLQSMVQTVAQPVFVDLNEDRERQLRALRKLVRFTAFLSFPLLFGFALVAPEFIVITITEKWLFSATLLQILCIGGALTPISTLLSNLIISKGRSDIYLYSTLCLGICEIILMFCLYPYGIRTMVIVYTALNILWMFVWHSFVWKQTGYNLLMLLKDLMPFAVIAAGTMILTYFATVSFSNLLLLLLARVAMAAAIYYLVLRLAHAKIMEECSNFILSKFKK